MAKGRAERLFGPLEPDEIGTLIARVWDVIPDLKLAGGQADEFERALQFHDLPIVPTSVRVAHEVIARKLKKHIVKHPLPALLNTALKQSHPLAADYDRLVAWTAIASLVLLERDEQHWSKADTACDAVRLAARPKEQAVLFHFEGKTAKADDILKTATRSALDDLFAPSSGPDRFDPIRVLLDAYLNYQPPVTRSRLHLEHSDTYYVTTVAQVTNADLDEDFDGTFDAGQTTAYLRSHGDRNNPEHMPHREFIDLPALGTREQHHNRPLQNLRRTSAAQHIMRRKMALPCTYGMLTDSEIFRIMRACVIKLDTDHGTAWHEKLLIGASLLTGRTPLELITMPRGKERPRHACTQWLEIDGYSVSLCFDPALPVPKFPRAYRALLDADRPQPLKLALPGPISSPLAELFKYLKNSAIEQDRIADAFKTLWPKGHRRQTLLRVAQVLRDRAIRAGLDPTIVAYLAGESPRNEPGLYYVTHDNAVIEQAYRDVLEALPGADLNFGRPVSHPVGSGLTVEKRAIRAFYQVAEASFIRLPRSNRSEIVAFHNRFVALVCFSLMLQTGHRPVKAMFERRSDIDFDAGLLFVSDKEIRVASSGRIIPLAEITLRQFAAWLSHLRNLRGRIDMRSPAIASACQSALDGTDFLLFEIRDDASGLSTVAVTPHFLTLQLSRNIWPFQLNWARHVQRRLLTSVRGELVDAWMGHAHPGAELFGPASGARFHDLGELREAASKILSGLGVRVFRGLT
jgi:hypothetical protein